MFGISDISSKARQFCQSTLFTEIKESVKTGVSLLSLSAKNVALYFVGDKIVGPFSTFIHEKGHEIAMQILFKNSNPEIVLHARGGGHCAWGFPNKTGIQSLWGLLDRPESAQLSLIGESLGRTNSFSLVSAAGPIVQIAAIVAVFFKYKNPELVPLMLSTAIHITLYAISALGQFPDCQPLGHDYCRVWSLSGQSAYTALAVAAMAPLGICLYQMGKNMFSYLDSVFPIE